MLICSLFFKKDQTGYIENGSYYRDQKIREANERGIEEEKQNFRQRFIELKREYELKVQELDIACDTENLTAVMILRKREKRQNKRNTNQKREMTNKWQK